MGDESGPRDGSGGPAVMAAEEQQYVLCMKKLLKWRQLEEEVEEKKSTLWNPVDARRDLITPTDILKHKCSRPASKLDLPDFGPGPSGVRSGKKRQE